MPAHVTLAGVIGTILRGGPQSQGIAARAALDILTSADVAGTLLQTALGRQGGAPFQGAAELAAAYTGFWELRTPGEGEADIFPGRRHALPVGEFEWVTRMPIPARVRRGTGGGGFWGGGRRWLCAVHASPLPHQLPACHAPAYLTLPFRRTRPNQTAERCRQPGHV
jgi:hypothetical protein